MSTFEGKTCSLRKSFTTVFLSLLIQLVLTSLLLESYAKKPFTSSSTRRCHLTHLPHQMCCRCICTVDRLRRFYLMKIKSKIQTASLSRSASRQHCCQILSH